MRPNLELAEAVLLAYEDPNFYASNVQARILQRRGVTTIAVAGSNDLSDWRENLSSHLVHRDGRGKIFNGFADMADDSKRSFLDYMKPFSGPFEIVAHSAGCPIATQWAGWLAEIGKAPQFVQLLAAPCTGNGDFAAYYRSFNIPTLSIGLVHDPVCEAYSSHGGTPVVETFWLDADGNRQERPDSRIDGLFKAHPTKNYIRAIRMHLMAG